MENIKEAGKAKKPFYKRWWFITFAVLLIIGVFVPKENTTNKTSDKVEIVKEEFIPFEFDCDKMYVINNMRLENLNNLKNSKVLPLAIKSKIQVNKDNILIKLETNKTIEYKIINKKNDALYDIQLETSGAIGRCGISKETQVIATDFGDGVIMYSK